MADKAISTYKTSLMYKATDSGSTYTKLIDIKEFPDLGGDPEMLETTTLTDSMQTYINGIQSSDGLEFTANYTSANYSAVDALADGKSHDFAIYFGDEGAEGKFTFSGMVSVRINGAGVNEVVEMTVTIAPTSEIVKAS